MSNNKNTDVQVVIAALEKQAKPINNKLLKLPAIKTQQEYDTIRERLKKLKDLGKQATAKEKEIVNPIQDSVKKIKALFKPFKDKVAETEAIVNPALVAWVDKQDAEIEKAEEDLESGKIKNVSTFARKVAKASVPTGSGRKKVWKLFIKDEKKIPREFLVPDETKIREAFKAGKKVAGCTWEQVNQVAV